MPFTNYVNNTQCPICNSSAITFDEETLHAKCSVCGMTVHKIFIDAIAKLDDEVSSLNEKLDFVLSTIAKADRANTILAKVVSDFIKKHPEYEDELNSLFIYHYKNTPTPTVKLHEVHETPSPNSTIQ